MNIFCKRGKNNENVFLCILSHYILKNPINLLFKKNAIYPTLRAISSYHHHYLESQESTYKVPWLWTIQLIILAVSSLIFRFNYAILTHRYYLNTISLKTMCSNLKEFLTQSRYDNVRNYNQLYTVIWAIIFKPIETVSIQFIKKNDSKVNWKYTMCSIFSRFHAIVLTRARARLFYSLFFSAKCKHSFTPSFVRVSALRATKIFYVAFVIIKKFSRLWKTYFGRSFSLY